MYWTSAQLKQEMKIREDIAKYQTKEANCRLALVALYNKVRKAQK